MLTKESSSLAKAKNYAFLLLKYRLRSEKEIAQRLKRKKFEDAAIKDTIAFLKDRDFLNDSVFAKAWIESRLKKPMGLRRIKQELAVKGINREVIEDQIRELEGLYPQEDVVIKLAQKRFEHLKNIEPLKAKQRIYAFLLRRGFSPDVVGEAISKL